VVMERACLRDASMHRHGWGAVIRHGSFYT
jgi:hypothetical protein